MCGPCVLEAATHGLTSSTAVPSTRSAPPSSSSSPRTPGRVGLQPGRVGLQPGRVGLQPGRVGLQPGRVGLQPGEVGLQQRRSVRVVAHAAQFDERETERAGAVRRPAREEPRSLAAEPRGVHLGLDCLEAEAVRGRDAQRPAPSGVHRGATQPLMHRVAASGAQGCSLWCTRLQPLVHRRLQPLSCSMLTSPPLRSKTHSSHTCEKCSSPSSAWLGLVPQRTRSRARAEPASPACRGVPFF